MCRKEGIKITVEELDIIVQAKVEEALKDLKKITPAMKKIKKEVEKDLDAIDVNQLSGTVQNASKNIKKNLKTAFDPNELSENFKKSVDKIFNESKKAISEISKESEKNNLIFSIAEKGKNAQGYTNYDNNIIDYIENFKTAKELTKQTKQESKSTTEQVKSEVSSLNKILNILKLTTQIWREEVSKVYQSIINAKNAFMQLGSSVVSASREIRGFYSGIVNSGKRIGSIVSQITKLGLKISGLEPLTKKFTTAFSSVERTTKRVLSILRGYALSLIGIRSTYYALKSVASSWLSSANSQAQQLNANLDYMKYSIGNALAPAITYIVNLVYSALKAVQNLIYAITKVNIFASSSADNYASMSGSAASTAKSMKQLAGIHDEINNISSDNSSSGGSGGITNPSIDLSEVDGELTDFQKRLIKFFEPLVKSWKKYGDELVEQLKTTVNQVLNLISSVWDSLENIITNGTIYSILNNILAIIGNIAEAWANAWNFKNNGDAIIQNLADALKNLLDAIESLTRSDKFQKWANWIIEKLEDISNILSKISWKSFIDSIAKLGGAISKISFEIIEKIVEALSWFVQNETIQKIINNLSDALENVWKSIKKLLESKKFKDFIEDLTDRFEKLTKILKKIKWDNLTNAFATFGKSIANFAMGMLEAIINALNWFAEHPTIANIVAKLAAAFIELKVIESVASTIKSGVSAISTSLDTLKTGFKSLGTIASNTLVSVMDSVSAISTEFAALSTVSQASIVGLTVLAGTVAYNMGYQVGEQIKVIAENIEVLKNPVVTLTDEMKAKINEVTSSTENFYSKVMDLADSWYEVSKASKEVVSSNVAEIEHASNLYEELKKIVDENGKIKEGYEERANVIVSTLNNALGTEYSITNGIIDNYNEMAESISKVVAQKKIEIALEAYEDDYIQALKEKKQAEEDVVTALEKMSKVREKMNELEKIGAESTTEYKKLKIALNEATSSFYQSSIAVEDYTNTINNYDSALAASVSGNTETMQNAFDTLTGGIEESTEIIDGTTQEIISSIQEVSEKSRVLTETTSNELKGKLSDTSKEILQNQQTAYSQQLDALTTNLAAQITTVEDMTQEEVEAWASLSQTSLEAFKSAIEKVPEEQRQALVDAVTVVTQDTNLPTSLKNLGVSGLMNYSEGINDIDDNTKTILENVTSIVNSNSSITSSFENKGTLASKLFKNNLTLGQGTEDSLNDIKNAINLNTTVGEAANSLGVNIADTIRNSTNAKVEGSELTSQYASGISSSSSLSKIKNAVSKVANTIKGFLHFSEPDVGPLSNFHTYMPDMMKEMAQGIHDNTSLVTNELEKLTLEMSYQVNTDISSTPDLLTTSTINLEQNQTTMEDVFDRVLSRYMSDNNISIPLTVNVGNEKLGQVLLSDLRNMKRRSGKNIEALVGG